MCCTVTVLKYVSADNTVAWSAVCNIPVIPTLCCIQLAFTIFNPIKLFGYTQPVKNAGFSVKTQLYCLIDQLHVLAVVLLPSSGRFKEYKNKEIKQLQYWLEI